MTRKFIQPSNIRRQVRPILSVVIPTLGFIKNQNCLQKLKERLGENIEILFILPTTTKFPKVYRKLGKIIYSKKGQTIQRARGIRVAKAKVVLQMDDDISISPRSLLLLYQVLVQKGPKNAVAPDFVDQKTRISIYQHHRGVQGWFRSLYYFFVCGAEFGKKRQGTVSPSGFNFGIDPSSSSQTLVSTQWLPGGCAMYFKKEFPKKMVYPFSGKAYLEDLFYSAARKKAGIEQWIVTRAKCFLTLSRKTEESRQLKARKKLVEETNGFKKNFFLYEKIITLKKIFFEK